MWGIRSSPWLQLSSSPDCDLCCMQQLCSAPVQQGQKEEGGMQKGGSGFARGPDYHRFITSCLPSSPPSPPPPQCTLLRHKLQLLQCMHAPALSKAQEWNKQSTSWFVKETRRREGKCNQIWHRTTHKCISEPPFGWAKTAFSTGLCKKHRIYFTNI